MAAQSTQAIKEEEVMGTKKSKKKKKEGAGDGQAQAPATVVPAVSVGVPASSVMEDDALREIAHAEKKKGNEEYLKKRYTAAVNHYTRGIAASAREPALLVLLLVNRAIAFIRIKVCQLHLHPPLDVNKYTGISFCCG